MGDRRNIKLNKRVYASNEAREQLEETFTEFNLKLYSEKEFFEHYNSLFFEIPLNGRLSHNTILHKSTKYAGTPENPKTREIQDLWLQLQKIQRQIDSVEKHHDLIPNRVILQNRDKPELKWYMQSGRKRKINKRSVVKLIKRQQGAGKLADSDFVVLMDQSAIDGILEGLPIDIETDLNISILEINRNALEGDASDPIH